MMGIFLCSARASAQQKTVTGTVTDEGDSPIAGASVLIKGTTTGTQTSASGSYSIRVAPGQVLQFRFVGATPVERTVGAENVISVRLRRVAVSLDAVVTTALGQTTAQRAIGTAQQTVQGPEIANTQRESFVNALQGRVAGVNVVSSSGVPGASSSITIRGVSSISSSNQPLMIVDGLPIDNKTLNTSALPSDRPGSSTAFNNRGVDFTNRAADINPEDIESISVLKGPEAAALYGIDAANGAIVITTKRGRAGSRGIEYTNSTRFESVRSYPEIQKRYSVSGFAGVGATAATTGSTTPLYYGAPYPDTTKFYDNVDGFFQTGISQKHNLAFGGATQDNRLNYRLSAGVVRQRGVIPNSYFNRVNVTAASQGDVNSWMRADLSMGYTNEANNQNYKGDNGPLLSLLVWPSTDNASDYLSVTGARRRLTAANAEIDNPYFGINKNFINSKVNRLIANVGVTVTPFSWGYLKTNLGADTYANQNLLLRHPESAFGLSSGGILDQADDVTRNLTAQTLFNFNSHQLTKSISVSGLVGNAVSDAKSTVDGGEGVQFLDANFVSVNNTLSRTSTSVTSQRRLVSAFAQAVLDYNHYAYLTLQGRNDWTSTIPEQRNSFFYPSVSTSFVYSDAFPAVGRHMTGKLRAAYAEVGRDARPYAYRSSLEAKTSCIRRLRIRLHRPEPEPPPRVREVVRARKRDGLPRRSSRPRRDGLPQDDDRPDRQRRARQLRHGIRAVQPERRLDPQSGARDHGAWCAGSYERLLVGRAGELRERARQGAQAPERLSRGVRVGHVALRQRAERRAAGTLHDVAHGPLLPAQQGRAAPHRPVDGTSAAVHHVHRRRLRPPAEVHDRSVQHLPIQPDRAGLPRRHPARWRRVQRHAALSHAARPQPADARS